MLRGFNTTLGILNPEPSQLLPQSVGLDCVQRWLSKCTGDLNAPVERPDACARMQRLWPGDILQTLHPKNSLQRVCHKLFFKKPCKRKSWLFIRILNTWIIPPEDA